MQRFLEYRNYGKTGLRLSALGLGVEHLKNLSSHEVSKIASLGFKAGINYIDLVWSMPNIIEGIADAVVKADTSINFAVHLGSAVKEDKYHRTRTPHECKASFMGVFENFSNKHTPIINIHYLSQYKEWKKYSKPGSVLDTAKELRDEGYGKYISVSTHSVEVVEEVAVHPDIDAVMFQVNMTNHVLKGRDNALASCRDNGKAVIAMKPYAGGRLLASDKRMKIAGYMRGGSSAEYLIPSTINSVKCLSYSLDQPGVCCAVSGPSNIDDLEDSLRYFDASNSGRNYRDELQFLLSQV